MTRVPAIHFEAVAYTDVGLHRTVNEDFFAVCTDVQRNIWDIGRQELLENNMGAVMIVADGVGGASAGDVAAQAAVEAIVKDFKKLRLLPENESGFRGFLKETIVNASHTIVKYAQERQLTAQMGTTLVVAWVLGNKAFIAWSGDSRAYLLRNNRPFAPLTDDHSRVWDMVKKGQITPEEARLHPDNHIITQCLGDAQFPPEPDVIGIDIKEGDRLLLCTDGLNSMLSDADLEKIMSQPVGTMTCAKGLIEAAKLAGGYDNITLTLMDIYGINEKPKNEPIVKHNLKNDSKDMALTAILLIGLLMIFVMSLVLNSYYEGVAEKSTQQDSTQAQMPQENAASSENEQENTPKPVQETEKPKVNPAPVSKKEWENLKKNYQTMLDRKEAIRKKIQGIKDKNKQTELTKKYGQLWNILKDIVDADSRLLEPKNQTELKKIQTSIDTCQKIIAELEKSL